MGFAQDEQRYIDFLLKEINMPRNSIGFKQIAEFEKKDEQIMRNKYHNKIYEWLAEKIFGAPITKENVEKIIGMRKTSDNVLKEMEEIKKAYDKGFAERKFGFIGDKDKKSKTYRSAEDKFKDWAKYKKENDLSWKFRNLDENALLEKYKNGEFGFKTLERFYDWYKGHSKEEKCYYCGTSQDDLNKLFKENNTDEKELEKPLYSTKPSFTATLQIDKMNPNEPYRPDNCVLACVFCNNAKSDWIKDANEFKNVFGAKIREFLKSKLPKEISQ